MNTKDKTYIIAEVGSTHDGSLGNLLNLIKLCKKWSRRCKNANTYS